MEYGYLPKSDTETGNLRTVDQLRIAIKTLQRNGNIPQTGVIDERTKMLIAEPRCGVPDFSNNDFKSRNRNHRSKRFVVYG